MVNSWFGVENTGYSKAEISTECVDENCISGINGLKIKVCFMEILVVFQLFPVEKTDGIGILPKFPILYVFPTRIPIVTVKDADGTLVTKETVERSHGETLYVLKPK